MLRKVFMQLEEAIKGRKSIRGFKPDPVNRDVLQSILESSIWAPSWGNTQPWEIAVIGSDVVKKLITEFLKRIKAGDPGNPDLEMPDSWPAVNKRRYVDVGRGLFTSLGIERSDKEARSNHYLNMYSLFGAPNIIYIYMDKKISPYYGPFDLGAVTNNICLLAHEKGLGTCILACSSHFTDVIREHVDISKDKIIVIGIAIGYPDENNLSYHFKSTRDKNVISWHGF